MIKIGYWAGIALFAALGCFGAAAAAEIKIVGSSTVFPFSDFVATAFRADTGLDVEVQSTGTGGGFARFCAGAGADFPDITGASRPIKAAEFDACAANGVGDVIELKIGHDGIVIANARTDLVVPFTIEALYLALADKIISAKGVVDNPYVKWSQIGAGLPDRQIVVYGPPETSGTRDSVETLALGAACKTRPGYQDLPEAERGPVCSTIRHDPYYVDMTEDDEDTVRALVADRSGFGIFGYSFLLENSETISAHEVDGVLPNFDTISGGSYPLARPLFVYVKRASLDGRDGVRAFLELFLADAMAGPGGALPQIGLVPATPGELAESRRRLAEGAAISRP